MAVIGVLAAPVVAGAQGVPSGWSASDIGSVGASGSSSGSGGSFTVRGAGADVWGTADAFHYAYRTLSGDGEIITHVQSVGYIQAWSKAGVMMRESLDAGARHAFMLVSPGKGDAFQRRPYAWGDSTSTNTGGGPGYYVRLTRTGNNFDAYQSADGANWSWVGSEWIDMPSTIYVGVAASSHVYGVLTTATFSETVVNQWSAAVASSASMPSGWADGDVGPVGAGGWAASSGNDFAMGGSGSDIWDYQDAFHYAYRTLSGDGSIVARVSSLDWTNAWSKAGVMMRESLSPSSTHAYMLVSAGSGAAFQRRPWTGGESVHTAGPAAGAPYYVKLVRSGNTFTGYGSWDGSNWTLIGSEYISMASTIYVGVAVTSHNYGTLANTYLSGVEVVQGAQTSPAFAAPAQPSSGGSGSTLRVMQWNVRHGGVGTDGVYSPDRVAAWIAWVNPDIVSLNEIDDQDELNNIVWALNARTGVAWTSTFSPTNSVVTRLPVMNQNYCWYSQYSGSYTNQVAAELTVNVGGRWLAMWSAHLNADSAWSRLNEVALLQGCLSWLPGLVAGDFNMQASSGEYWAMVGGGFIDAWDAARNIGTNYNYSGNCDGCTRNSRIDYVFSTSSAWYLTVQSAQMIDTRDAYGYMPSDHKPFVITYNVAP
jgi:endonuclease/exonuclease/phosphatase family metal-dependent hydrolase